MRTRRPWAWPLVPVYAAAVWVKERLRGEPKRLGWPVVSVGSLSAGGAGKTPVVIALALMLKERGWAVRVLSRGYGRAKGNQPFAKVDPEVPEADILYGDEPTLMARRAVVPVWVGKDRYEAGTAAETLAKESSPGAQPKTRGVHLLDDGFQHRQLARTVDIVLVTAEDLDEALLPAGNRREGLAALQRADVVVVREEETALERAVKGMSDREIVELVDWLKPFLREGALVWTVRRRLRFPGPLFVFSAGLRPVAFCAIARPAGFAEMLLKAGCGVVDTIFFADHHAYDMEDMDRIVQLGIELKASGFVTTEKDAVKLTPAMRARLETLGPVMIAALDTEFVFPERVARELESRLVQDSPAEPLASADEA